MDDLAYVDGLTGDVMTQFSLLPLIEEVGQRLIQLHVLIYKIC